MGLRAPLHRSQLVRMWKMFEAYAVAIKLNLVNNAASGLAALSVQLIKGSKDADELHSRLAKIQKLAMIGAGMTAGGIFGLGIIAKAIKPAEEYVHQLNIMNMAGMKQADIADAVGAAWKLAGQNMTTTATGNLKSLLDLRNITGSLQEAKEFLPIMARMQTVLASSKEGKVSGAAGDLAFSAMKALDIRGAVNDPERLKREADLMTRVIEGTQGRVTPEMFRSVFQYARQGKFSLTDDFAYKILPTLMLESASGNGAGGGSRGVGPMIAAMYRVTNQGFINRKSLGLWEAIGEVRAGSALHTSTPGTVAAPMRDSELAGGNPFLFTNLIVDRLYKKFGKAAKDELIVQKLNELYRGNQLAASMAVEFFVKRRNFERDQRLFEGVMSPNEAYRSAMSNDPETAHRALAAQWENFKISLTMGIVPIVVPALISLSKGLNALGDWARANPNLTKNLVIGFAGLSTAMAIGGTLTLVTAGFKGLSLVIGGVGMVGSLSKVIGLIGVIGTSGTLLFALAGLAGIIGALIALGPEKPDKPGENNHPGMHFERHGRGGKYVSDIRQMGPKSAMYQHYDHATEKWGEPVLNTVATGANKPPVTINNKIVMPDGRVLADIVTKEQVKGISRPLAGVSGVDTGMFLLHPSMNTGH